MIYLAKELLAKLKYLKLAGQNPDGELEWFGTREDWARAEAE